MNSKNNISNWYLQSFNKTFLLNLLISKGIFPLPLNGLAYKKELKISYNKVYRMTPGNNLLHLILFIAFYKVAVSQLSRLF